MLIFTTVFLKVFDFSHQRLECRCNPLGGVFLEFICTAGFLYCTMSVVSRSVHHRTLLSAVSELYTHNDQMKIRGDYTQFPIEKISDEILNPLVITDAKIAQQQTKETKT